jgi:hypothetical protein
MLKDVFILLISNFVEVIHVELPYKRREVSMSKVSWQNLLLEALNIQNRKMSALFIPSNNS